MAVAKVAAQLLVARAAKTKLKMPLLPRLVRQRDNGAPTKSLLPWDSASCLEPLELLDEGNGSDDEKPFMDDEDNEYEDDEFFESLKQWASDVWTSTHPDSRSDSEVTLVGAAAGSALSKSVEPTTSPPLALLLSVQ
jgi:hypothetical protein